MAWWNLRTVTRGGAGRRGALKTLAGMTLGGVAAAGREALPVAAQDRCRCKPAPNECIATLCDVEDRCVQVEVMRGTLCNDGNGYCLEAKCRRCEPNETVCPEGAGFVCADLKRNEYHCGSCGYECNTRTLPGEFCRGGVCVPAM